MPIIGFFTLGHCICHNLSSFLLIILLFKQLQFLPEVLSGLINTGRGENAIRGELHRVIICFYSRKHGSYSRLTMRLIRTNKSKNITYITKKGGKFIK